LKSSSDFNLGASDVPPSSMKYQTMQAYGKNRGIITCRHMEKIIGV
jgi:hypothetical protein